MLNKAMEIESYVVDIRRYLHMNPELSSQEFNTQRLIIEELEKLGIEARKAGETSVIGILKGAKPGRIVALRADTDALPIVEKSGEAFESKKQGIMHACGHDAHTAMLLGAARILSGMKDSISGEVRFIFQEAEETFHGAKKIIQAGGVDGVDACFGLHGMQNLETGYVSLYSGYRMAGCDTIFIRFEGVSGHGSMPHLAKDTIYPACAFVNDLQNIVTKRVDAQDPVVLSVGKFSGGTKANIIANSTQIDISMRYFNPEARTIVHEAIKSRAKAFAEAYEIDINVDIEESAVSLYNDEHLTSLAQASAEKVMGPGKNIPLPRFMGSEDFAYYQEHTNCVYAIMGYRNADKGTIYPPHNEKFRLDEDYMKYGTALYAQFAMDFLGQ